MNWTSHIIHTNQDKRCHYNCDECPMMFNEYILKESLADGKVFEFFCEDFTIIHGRFNLYDNRLIREDYQNKVRMLFQFCGGRIVNKNEVSWNCSTHQHFLFISQGGEDVLQELICGEQHFVEIFLDRSIFNKFIPKSLFDLQYTNNPKPYSINAAMSLILKQIISPCCHHELHYLMLSAKIQELLLLQIESILKEQPAENNEVHTIEKHRDKIYAAKTFIDNNLDRPCTLIDLAKQVGTNEYTLKKGFREILDTTVFNYWNDLKMKKAYRMIEDGDSPIKDIAYDSGFKTVQHFSAAFKKKFGVSPSSIRNHK